LFLPFNHRQGKKNKAKKGHKRHAPKQNGEAAPGPTDATSNGQNPVVKGGNPLLNGTIKRLDRSKQRAIVKRLMAQADEQGLQVGDKRFVLSAKWWERWCEFVGYDEKQDTPAAGAGNPPPSRINNLPLLHVGSDTPLDELMGGPLRPQLKENYHYVLIPQEVWDVLLLWYAGGPTIARFVVQVGDPELGNAFNRVQVYPVRVL
jgi:hypothetical protein